MRRREKKRYDYVLYARIIRLTAEGGPRADDERLAGNLSGFVQTALLIQSTARRGYILSRLIPAQ